MQELSPDQKYILDLISRLPHEEQKGIVEEFLSRREIIREKGSDLFEVIHIGTKKDMQIGQLESKENPEDIVYYGIPDLSGVFENTDKKLAHIPGQSYYKINKVSHEVRYIPGGFDKRAIENIENYLLPACDIENFSDRRTASRIQVLAPGKIISHNGGWKIDQNHKIKIRLI